MLDAIIISWIALDMMSDLYLGGKGDSSSNVEAPIES